MKKLFKFLVGSLLLVSALSANEMGFTNKIKLSKNKYKNVISSYMIKGSSTLWSIYNVKNIESRSTKSTFRILKKRICSSPKAREILAKGITLEFIYIADKNHKVVVYKINTCNK